VELRHLRYFVAAAESRSLKLAATQKLHTTQPSLSRQIRDLEEEVGTPLFVRGARGVELTPAGRVFLDHARVMLSQAETAIQSARQIASPTKPVLALGFMIGHDSTWVPEVLHLLRDDLPNLHVVISTQNSPQLGAALSQNRIDLAFLRRDDGSPDLDFRLLVEEPLELYLPVNHRLAAQQAIPIDQIAGETFLSVSGSALNLSGRPPALRRTIDRYLDQSGIHIRPRHEVDNLTAIMSLIASTQGVALLPAYARTFLLPSVTSRPLTDPAPTIDLSVGYRRANTSPQLQRFLSRIGQLGKNGASAS
jgi:LysR family hca operon transcriptional activator